MDWKTAKAKARLCYIGQPCKRCWCRKRYTSNRACVACHASRSYDRKDLSPDALATLRATDAARKARQRAKLQGVTPWQTIIQLSVD